MNDATQKEAERRGKHDRFVLQYYTAPRDGGHREIMSVERFDARTEKEWSKLYRRFSGKNMMYRWFFKTVEEAMEFDRWLWKTRYLDKKLSVEEILRGVRFE